LFYRDARRRGEVKDNFISILRNIGGENRARMRNRLLEIMPDLDARIEAILTTQKLAKEYTTPSKFTKKV
jgi:DNA-directed RNA polymerase subunit F